MTEEDFDDDVPVSTSLGRSFMATGGKTLADVKDDAVNIETLVSTTNHLVGDDVVFESRRILNLAPAPISVAELAAHLKIPLLATQLLVSQMVAEGLLTAARSVDPDQALDLTTLQLIRARFAAL